MSQLRPRLPRPQRSRTSGALLGCTLSLSASVAAAHTDDPAIVFINELHYDNAGTDVAEAIEIAGPAGTSLSGYSLVLYNGNDRRPYSTRTLSGVLPDHGAGLGTLALSYPTDGIQNGAPDAVALVNPSGHVVQFLSYEGAFVGLSGPADGVASTDIGVAEGSTTALGLSLALTGTGLTYQDFTWSADVAGSFGAPNPGQRFETEQGGGGGGEPCSAADVSIGTVQGSGDIAVAGAATVQGVVVGDYEGPAPALRGFFVQDSGDGNPLTSDAIFVFRGNEDTVSLGEVVQVSGTVSEFQGQSQISAATVEKCSATLAIAPTPVTLPVASPTYLERYEGMLVTFPQTLSVTEHFQLGRFGEIVVSSGGRLVQPTAVVEPGAAAAALAAQNALNRLILDDANNAQNADPILFGRGGQPLTAENTLRGGDTVTGATGVLTYTWAGNSASGNAYRLRVVGDLSDTGAVPGGIVPTFIAADARPTGVPSVAGRLKIASFNVLNYFLTLDASGNRCGPSGSEQECRGAESSAEFERQRAKLLSALASLDADVLGLIELENSEGVEPLADLAAGLNALLGAGTYAYVDTGVIGTDAIKVGILYRPEAVATLGEYAVLDASVDPRFDTTRNRPALAQSFVELASGEVFTTVVNHLKSKSCGGASGADADRGDGQGCWNATRTAAAQAEVEWLASAPTGTPDPDVLVLGDLNAYAKEEPVQAFVDAGYVDLPAQFATRPYSYVFDGQWGYLDHALASPSMVRQVAAATDVHINADEPSVLDYNTNFKSAAQLASLYAPDRYRTSDHDPVLIGLTLAGVPELKLSAKPASLWPPNHRLVVVSIEGWAEGASASVRVSDAQSSEADCCLDADDLPGDIVLSSEGTVSLRAERYARAGRSYALELEVLSASGQVVFRDVSVQVPHSRGR